MSSSLMQPRSRNALLAAVGLLAAACYEYRPATDLASLQGRQVELTLTDSGAVILAGRIGPAIAAINGTYLGDSAGAYLLAVTTSRARNGQEVDWRGEHVVAPRPLVAAILERRFSRSRTTFAGVLAAVGIGGMTAALRGRGESNAGIPSTPPPPPK